MKRATGAHYGNSYIESGPYGVRAKHESPFLAMKRAEQKIRRVVRESASPNVIAFPIARARLPKARRLSASKPAHVVLLAREAMA